MFYLEVPTKHQYEGDQYQEHLNNDRSITAHYPIELLHILMAFLDIS